MSKKVIVFLLLLAAGNFIWRKNHSLQTPPQTRSTALSPEAALLTPTPSTETLTEAPIRGLEKLSKPDQRKFRILGEIFASKNDNDPRMDEDLAVLSPELRHAMIEFYKQIEPEKRNQRGTIVFLIARNIGTKSDVDFLKSVLMEPPCASLQNCNESHGAASGADSHLEGVNETTANYPQLMAVRESLQSYKAILGNPHADQSLAGDIVDALREATHSPNRRVVQEAKNALHYIGKQ